MTTDPHNNNAAINGNNKIHNQFLNPLTMKRTKSATTSTHGLALLALTCYALWSAPTAAATASDQHAWRIITRSEWHARAPTERHNFTGAAPYVIVHHSYQPGVCLTGDACKAAMRSMQHFHMDGHGWPDIGYSYAVGGDGNVYEGRGFNVIGAHAPKYNDRSVGLLLIGNFVENAPPAPMLQVAQQFLRYAVNGGHLREDYILYGHRQVRNTQCPGEALYSEIQQWPHYKAQTNA